MKVYLIFGVQQLLYESVNISVALQIINRWDTSPKPTWIALVQYSLVTYFISVLRCAPEYFTYMSAARIRIGGNLGEAEGNPQLPTGFWLSTYMGGGSQIELDCIGELFLGLLCRLAANPIHFFFLFFYYNFWYQSVLEKDLDSHCSNFEKSCFDLLG